MIKKIKLKSLYLISLGNITGSYSQKKYNVIEGTGVLAHAKYEIFNKGKIKYFINVLDGTKYCHMDKVESGICVMNAIPISVILKENSELKRKYITQEKAIEILQEHPKFVEIDNIEHENNTVKKDDDRLLCGKILNEVLGNVSPTIGREKEVESLIISLAQQKKNPILVGPPGVGKTAIADTLAYNIVKGEVPVFLKERQIIEVSAAEIVSGSKYVGEFEKRMLSLIEYIQKNNAILLINEIHNIYGVGATEKTNLDIAEMLKNAIDRNQIKIIGTTTKEEYKNYFASSALKRRFDIINVDEPKRELLYEIISYTLDNYYRNTGVSIDKLDNSIIDILIDLTDNKHRKFDDKVYNPDLAIGIIDKAFAIALVYDSPHLTNEHIIKAIETNERIYEKAKQNAVAQINNLCVIKKTPQKILHLR